MQGGAAGGARSRPPSDLHQGVTRFPLYSLFPTTQGANRPTITKVTESLFSTSLSTFGVPTPPPHSPYSPYSPLQLELINCAQRVLVTEKETSKMEEAKLTKCMPDPMCCPEQRPLVESVMMQPLTIKTEQAKRACNSCLTNSPKKMLHTDGGCSRTNPVTWLGVAGQNVQVQVKREPQHVHVSELVAVKLEQASPGTKHDQPTIPASLNNGSIPVGIAVARQRVGDAGLIAALSQKDNQHARMHEMDAAQAAMTVGVANVLCDERPAPLAWPAPPAPAPPAPLWQYPAAQVSMESMMVGGMGGMNMSGMGSVGGGGFQLVREPTSGALLLLPAPPDLQHAVVWGGMPYPSAPLLLPPAPHPPHLQLLPGDLLASTATLQHTHTHSTRLVTLAPAPQPQPHPHTTDKRKPIIQPLITPHALIKIEPEPPQEKPQPTFIQEPQQPMMTTHLTYYQPDYAQEQACRSQATSPVVPPTPPPEAPEVPAHRDASNQTDHIDDDDESPNHADEDERDIACVGVAHFPEEQNMQTQTSIVPPIDSAEESSSEGMATAVVAGAVEKAIDAIERDEALDNSSSGGSNDLVIDTARSTPVSQPSSQTPGSLVDVSGLELLSNSIEQFERTTPHSMPSLDPAPLTVDTRTTTKLNIMIKTSPKSPPRTEAEPHRRFEFPSTEPSTSEQAKPSLDGLGLLCALAEQRIMQEVQETPSIMSSRPFIKSELLSPTERDRSSEKKERHRRRDSEHRHRDGDSSGERKRKKSGDREERLRHKLEKMRRHKRDSEGRNRSELEASLRRVTACSCGLAKCVHTPPVPSAHALVNAIEKDMRERLQELERQCDAKRAQLNALTPPLPALSTPSTPSTPALSPDSDRGSSQKRKVGRPRKVSSPDSTETIVAKKPKSKSSLVGYLLAKGKLKGGILCSRGEPKREEGHRTSKVRPKLKAEPILKMYTEEDETEWGLNRSVSSSMESLNEVRQKNREKVDRLARKHSRDDLPEYEFAMRRESGSSESDKERRRAKKRRKSVKSKDRSEERKEGPSETVKLQASKCTLTEDKLDNAPRVLTAMGGLFYAGKLSAVQAPDVYAITLDGERGNKPHILSREETLRDAILEVSPTSVTELPSGTRVCAYWSQQYRCLYPGTVAVSSPDPHDDKFVAVEFDDGDSGRIAIEDIRFLEPNYPVVEYENPLFTLGKRRRNTSVTEEKKPVASTSDTKAPTDPTQSKSDDDEEKHKDRKKLKKHRKDKLKRHSSEDDPTADYIKKKKKKHKCCEEHCKHRRHHKKHHRKHRKRHHSSSKEHSSSSGDDQQKQKSSSDYIDSNKSNEDSGDSNDRLSTLIAMEKSPDDKMKTVIKKAVLSKKSLVKNAVLDFSNIGKTVLKKDEDNNKDNLKDSGIGLEEETPTTSVLTDSPKKKTKRRTVSSTSSDGGMATGGVSKMAAFLPGGALWRWLGPAYRRTARPRHRKLFYKSIQRGEETLHVGDAAVFLSTGRPDRPYIGRIVALWEARGAMAVRVKWFYHPEETVPCQEQLQYPGGLFESPHTDENDVQTISHKCEVLPLAQYKERMGDDLAKYSLVYDNNDVYYLAGHYDPTQQTLRMESDIPVAEKESS